MSQPGSGMGRARMGVEPGLLGLYSKDLGLVQWLGG